MPTGASFLVHTNVQGDIPMKALCFDNPGGPEVLYYGEVADPEIGENEILVRTKAIGLNFSDVNRRKGTYSLMGKPPYISGFEGAGIVEKVGSQVKGIKTGDRIGFADVPCANAELVAVPYHQAIAIPEFISFEHAAALLLQGLTAQHLCHDCYKVQPLDTVLIHAVAGGVGQLLTQMVKHLKATVIGLTSTEEKKAAALNNGADHVILYQEDWVNQVLEITKHKGVDVVYDSVGKTLNESFQACKTKGTVIFYGMAGGEPDKIDPCMLMSTSKTLKGGDLWHYLTTREEHASRAFKLFKSYNNGIIKANIDKTFALKDGTLAHEYMESRQSKGKILLIP